MGLTLPLGRRTIPGVARVRDLIRYNRTTAHRYGVAIVVTALVLLAWLAVDALAHIRLHLLLLTAVTISAWHGGRGPGVLAAVLSLIALVLPVGRASLAALDVPVVGETAYLGTFLLVAGIIGATTASLRRERAQAVARAAQLEDLNAEVEAQMEEVQTLSEHLQESNESLSDALAYARDVAARGMRLQDVTAALALAPTENEVADVLGAGLSAIGAARGFLTRVHGDQVEPVRMWGYEPELQARLLCRKSQVAVLMRAVQTAKPIWLRSPEEHRKEYWVNPDLAVTPVPHASVAIPLLDGDAVIGLLGAAFIEPSSVGPATEAFSLLLGQAAANALARARSYDAERAARQRAEVLAQARAEVLSVVAHDLRNPLSLIASSASLQLEVVDLPSDRRRKLLELTQRAVRQMNRLIADLLDATRLQAGRLTLDLRDVDARLLVREAGETLRLAAEEKGIELRVEPPDEKSIVRADDGRLLQAMGNLVGNALKFTATGGRVVLSARPQGVEIVFSVADNGPGIPAEHLDHLFDRFWQARDGDRRGVGLGLAITKGIVEAHGGRVWVESTVGVGSTFSFALPVETVVTLPNRS